MPPPKIDRNALMYDVWLNRKDLGLTLKDIGRQFGVSAVCVHKICWTIHDRLDANEPIYRKTGPRPGSSWRRRGL